MVNFNNLGAYHFVTELDILEISTAATGVDVKITDGSGAALLDTTYVPIDGAVRIYDLAKLISPAIADTVDDFTFIVAGASKTVHAVQSSVDIGESAADFLPNYFLSTVMTERDTAIGRKEILSLLPIEATMPTVTAECLYWDGTSLNSATVALSADLSAGEVAEIDVSPSLFVDEQRGVLVAFEIHAGKRCMRYRVASLPEAPVAFLFRNTFGAWEPAYLAGTRESTPEYTRDTAKVNGRLRVYDLEETDSAKSWSGPLRPGGVALMRDLARSTDVLLLVDGVAGDGVVVTGVEVKHTTDDADLPDFTFTWRRASRFSAKLTPLHLPKLFDPTFDETFN